MSAENPEPTKIANTNPRIIQENEIAVDESLRRYLTLVKRIFEYIREHDPKTLTELRRRARLRRKSRKAHS